jgi:hypothetical protein
MKLSLVPMLLSGKSISPEARQALRENRLRDAADILMKEYGLTWAEASQLLDISRAKGQLIRRERRSQLPPELFERVARRHAIK